MQVLSIQKTCCNKIYKKLTVLDSPDPYNLDLLIKIVFKDAWTKYTLKNPWSEKQVLSFH